MMATLAIGQIVIEPTGFKPGDRIPEFVARCYLEASLGGLKFAYGNSESEALENLHAKIEEVDS